MLSSCSSLNNEFIWDDLKLFERESETLKHLDLPSIPCYLDYFEFDLPKLRGFALVQTYLDAPSLEDRDGLLTIFDVEGFPIQRHWYVIYPSGKQLSVAAQTFLNFAIAEGRAIIDRYSADLIPR